MVTTVAPTIPVEAASSIPTIVTDRPSPPGRRPNSRPRVSSSCSDSLERSSITPMKMKSGTATRTSLTMTPNQREGRPASRCRSKAPSAAPSSAKANAVPASENATGKPSKRTPQVVANSARLRTSAACTAQSAVRLVLMHRCANSAMAHSDQEAAPGEGCALGEDQAAEQQDHGLEQEQPGQAARLARASSPSQEWST